MSTFTGSYSVQHRALTVPDILLNIFSLLDQSAARQCSLVCHAWREPALAIFWRHLDDPFDFGVYLDQAPLTVALNSPLELVQQMFVKLGARYVVVTNADGYCKPSPRFSLTFGGG